MKYFCTRTNLIAHTVVGSDDFFDRYLSVNKETYESNDEITKVYVVVKSNPAAPDSEAEIFKTIQAGDGDENGSIERPFHRTFRLKINFTAAETAVLMNDFYYFFSVKYVTESGKNYTALSGLMVAAPGGVEAVS